MSDTKDTVVKDDEKPRRKSFTAQDILDADDYKEVEVEVPEWGADKVVRLRTLTAEEMTDFVDAAGKDKGNSSVRVLMMSAIGDDGQNLFPWGNDVETNKMIARLKKKSMRALMRVQSAAVELNGLNIQAQAATKND